MSFDFSKLRTPSGPAGETDPIRLFSSLRVRDSNINDLWMGQGDALRQWHEARSREDVAIVLSTGAGKTLVGLLVAQSLVHEGIGPVVYVCASIQLVQQTATKGASYGLPVTTYFRGNFSDDGYYDGTRPCVTTYQALFNGLTHKWDDVAAIVFDDAHAATNIIRSQFTLRVRRDRYPEIFNVVTDTFSEYLRETGSDFGLREAMERGEPGQSWFVPPFVVRKNLGELHTALLNARLDEDDSLRFAWGYLNDRTDVCAVFLSPHDVSFTPAVIPVSTLPYFQTGVRRVYMSATLAAEDAFIRTFGKAPDRVISPGTPAGRCERMILIPRAVPNVDDDVAAAKATIDREKALILVPSFRESTAWDDVASDALENDDAAAQVEEFKKASSPVKLRLVARYDGVDLPGDTCRVMVIHGLPSGLGPLERFMWERLRVLNIFRSTVASRIVQSFGRISRGMTDHGVVIVTGKQLVEWLRKPSNRAALPGFLRSQIELGIELSKQLDAAQLLDVASRCLSRDEGWISYYENCMAQQDGSGDGDADESLANAARIEAEFGRHIWHRDYEDAARALHVGREDLFSVSSGLGSWYLIWEGYALELLGNKDEAIQLYQQARHAEKTFPPIVTVRGGAEVDEHPDAMQIRAVFEYLYEAKGVLRRFDRDTRALGEGTVAQVEEAVRCLGRYLGLSAKRPDNDVDTGPDVLWWMPDKVAWSLELKTEKAAGGRYSKRNVMQAVDHVQWVRDNEDVSEVIPFIVGPVLPADERANPPAVLRVMELAELVELRNRVRAAIESVLASYLPVTLQNEIRRVFESSGLLWSTLGSEPRGVTLSEVS